MTSATDLSTALIPFPDHRLQLPWLSWWDLQGKLLLTGEERADSLTAQLRRHVRGASRREVACR